jgi:hypothetical protein
MVEGGAGEQISELTASRDLAAMVRAELLEPVGEKRGRYYVARPPLLEARERVRADRPPKESNDPFAIASGQLQLATG